MGNCDWLLGYGHRAGIERTKQGLLLTNGILSREFAFAPDFCCVSLLNLRTGEEHLRSIEPEAYLTIDGQTYSVGGVRGLTERAFLPQSMDGLTAGDGFTYRGHRETGITRDIRWKRRWNVNLPFPPEGKAVEIHFSSDAPALRGIDVYITYEIYDDLPATGKRLRVENAAGREILLNAFELERLALVDPEDTTSTPPMRAGNTLFVGDVYKRNLFASSDIENQFTPTFRYHQDKSYTSQVNYSCDYPAILISKPEIGPHARVAAGASFTSYTAFVMLHESRDADRRCLELARFYRALAPWCMENPMYLHVVSVDEQIVHAAIDQCADVGFDMVILSFGSGLNMEDVSEANIAKFKALADYAHGKGIAIGGYSLLASRHIDEANDAVTDSAIFGSAPCLGSEWGIRYIEKIKTFFERTGFDVFEHDGSYAGDVCRSVSHPGHECFEDSLYTQLMQITELYRWMRERGKYTTVPDLYFMAGNTKVCMGYKEVNWSLPRANQVILQRQNIHDGTFVKPPSMGWMFVPLTQYHGGGKEATIEPLCEHLPHYELMLMGNMLAGVNACYRGFRLYDTPETRALVASCTAFFHAYRAILEKPFVRIRRPDGARFDGYMHVDPEGETRGLIALFNPRKAEATERMRIPMYYTGLTGEATVCRFDRDVARVGIDDAGWMEMEITIPAEGYVWFTVKRA